MRKATPGPTETLAETVRVHSRRCFGCRRFDREVMISVGAPTSDNPNRILDTFLTEEQARTLHAELERVLQENTWTKIAADLGIEATDAANLAAVIEARWVEASAGLHREEAEKLRAAYARLEARDLAMCRRTSFDGQPGGGVCRCLNPKSPVVCDGCEDG